MKGHLQAFDTMSTITGHSDDPKLQGTSTTLVFKIKTLCLKCELFYIG